MSTNEKNTSRLIVPLLACALIALAVYVGVMMRGGGAPEAASRPVETVEGGMAQTRPGNARDDADSELTRAEGHELYEANAPTPKTRPTGEVLDQRALTSQVSGLTVAGAPSSPVAVTRPTEEGGIVSPSIEDYNTIIENAFRLVKDRPLSTFSIDVDTASYANMRRFLQHNQMPPRDAVRIEELINYFDYGYEGPEGEHPFATHVEVATCPWQTDHRLVRIGIKGKTIETKERPNSNIVFLLDVSGSMNSANKLPYVKKSLEMLLKQLGEKDRVAIVVYAGASGLALPSTTCNERAKILAALENLQAGGSTNGGAGIQLAYRVAVENFIEGGVNRVILCTDGDFNVGVTSRGDLVKLAEEKAKSGVYLSILGFGNGNLKDSTMEQISGKANGNYSYIDTLKEAKKVLVEQMSGTLFTIAKDVKIQIEFNPQKVASYRLIGYENRVLRKEDFNNDKVDAGDIGAGHSVTALYEIVPTGIASDPASTVDPLRYQTEKDLSAAADSDELLTLKLRYKAPDGDRSKLIVSPVRDDTKPFDDASPSFRWAASVAGFGMILRDSKYRGDISTGTILELAEEGLAQDKHGYRKEFIDLVKASQRLMATR